MIITKKKCKLNVSITIFSNGIKILCIFNTWFYLIYLFIYLFNQKKYEFVFGRALFNPLSKNGKSFFATANLSSHSRPHNLTGQARRALNREAAWRAMVTLD